MEVRVFAETILHGMDLESKLVSPPTFTDGQRGEGLCEAPWPGRPAGLTLQDWHERPRMAFPGAGSLASPQARGHALHFFANHELLALELMALALLRFPDAPAAFRRGLVSTMREEQDHLCAYIARMRELGVSFGDAPVNDFFWRTLSGMQSPLDFVVRMSLTFEQANLDFALAYEELFATVGDTDTANLMRRVHDDEIGHVRHGLAWLRAWKNSGTPDWDAYCDALPPELSPARAKGQRYFPEARREAGFDENYIEKLGVFARSKGRPPQVWVFNPTVEMDWAAEARGKRTLDAPSAAVRDLVADFAALPAFLSAHNDIVVVETLPSTTHLARLRTAGFTLPEFVARPVLATPTFTSRRLAKAVPWGWSRSFRTREACWLGATENATGGGMPEDTAAALARKDAMARWEDTLLKDAQEGRLEPLLADVCTLVRGNATHSSPLGSLGDLETILMRSASGPAPRRWVVKASYSSSGRERVFFEVHNGRVTCEKSLAWIRSRLSDTQKNGAPKESDDRGHAPKLVLEPWLERVADFSVQIQVDPALPGERNDQSHGTCRVLGVTRFACDARGRYFGTALGRRSSGLSAELVSFLYQNPSGRSLLEGLEALGRWLGNELAQKHGYCGPLGLDTFLYRDVQSGALFLRPFVEFNPRFTMGRVALELGRRVAPQSSAAWLQVSSEELREPVRAVWERLQKASPLVFATAGNSRTPFLRTGALATNDPGHARRFLSVLVAETSAAALVDRCAVVSDVLGERAHALFPG